MSLKFQVKRVVWIQARMVRKLVIGLLLFAGLRALLKGLQIWN